MNLPDLTTLHQLELLQVQSGFMRDIDALYRDIAENLLSEIRSGREFTEYQGQRLQRAINEITAQFNVDAPNMSDLAAIEAQAAINNLAFVGITASIPSRATLEKIASNTFISGNTLGDWFTQLNLGTRQRIDREIKLGVSLGQTNAEIAKRIVGLRAGDIGSEALTISKRDAMSITRSSVIAISNESAYQTYQANDDVIKGVEHLATLDSRTCPTCAPRDGCAWDFDGNQFAGNKIPFMRPPIHLNCRCFLSPVTKSFGDLGLDIAELPAGTRASQYGQVSENMTFSKFIDRQGAEFAERVLGKGRYELYKKNNLTLNDLLNPRTFTPLSLADLKQKYN